MWKRYSRSTSLSLVSSDGVAFAIIEFLSNKVVRFMPSLKLKCQAMSVWRILSIEIANKLKKASQSIKEKTMDFSNSFFFKIRIFPIFFIITFVVISENSYGDTLDKEFDAAIRAVEERNYLLLRDIISRNKGLVDYKPNNNCPLMCEFSQLVRDPLVDEFNSQIDLKAIGILLELGADAQMVPKIVFDLMILANDHFGNEQSFPINSGQCLPNREETIELVGRLIKSGARLDTVVSAPDGKEFTTAFWYTYQLCHRPYVCSSINENVSDAVSLSVRKSITSAEIENIEHLVEGNVLDEACVDQFLQ